jgi:hypothetical protein
VAYLKALPIIIVCLTSEAAEIYKKPANNLIDICDMNIVNNFYSFFCTVHCDKIMQHRPTKCTSQKTQLKH